METEKNKILVHQVANDIFYVGFPLIETGIRYEGVEAAMNYLNLVEPVTLSKGIDFNGVSPEVIDLFEARRKELVSLLSESN